MSQPITIVLVDDQMLMREALALRLSQEAGFRVLATVRDADAAVREAELHKPDVVLMDIDMPGRCCFDAARLIAAASPETAILFVSAFCHDRYIEEALAAGAAGYLTKDESPQTLIAAIHAARAGSAYYSPEIAARVVADGAGLRLSQSTNARVSTLTPRELEILRYIARGMSRKEIARTRQVSEKTVVNHTSNLMNKLNIHDRVDLTRFAIREGLATA
jgi:DNA-binding NarL/FixJ family response regulator